MITAREVLDLLETLHTGQAWIAKISEGDIAKGTIVIIQKLVKNKVIFIIEGNDKDNEQSWPQEDFLKVFKQY